MHPKFKFLFSPDVVDREDWYLQVISTLGDADYCKRGTLYDDSATHVVVESLENSETVFCALAAGKWIIYVKFLEDSAAKGHWLDPEEYEVGSFQQNQVNSEDEVHFNAPQRCREEVIVRMRPLLATWRVGVLIYNYENRRAATRILTAGGAQIKILHFPGDGVVIRAHPKVDWILTECPYKRMLDEILEWKIPLRPLSYLVDYLLIGHPVPSRIAYPFRDCIHVHSSFLTRNRRQSLKRNIVVHKHLDNQLSLEDVATYRNESRKCIPASNPGRYPCKLSNENSPLYSRENRPSAHLSMKNHLRSSNKNSNACEVRDRFLTPRAVENVILTDTTSCNSAGSFKKEDGEHSCGGLNSKIISSSSEKDKLNLPLFNNKPATVLDEQTSCATGKYAKTSQPSGCNKYSSGNTNELILGQVVKEEVVDTCGKTTVCNPNVIACTQEVKSKEVESPIFSHQLIQSFQNKLKIVDHINEGSNIILQQTMVKPSFSFNLTRVERKRTFNSSLQSSAGESQMPPKKRRYFAGELLKKGRNSRGNSKMNQRNKITKYLRPYSSFDGTLNSNQGSHSASVDSNHVISLCSDDESSSMLSDDDDIISIHNDSPPASPKQHSNQYHPVPLSPDIQSTACKHAIQDRDVLFLKSESIYSPTSDIIDYNIASSATKMSTESVQGIKSEGSLEIISVEDVGSVIRPQNSYDPSVIELDVDVSSDYEIEDSCVMTLSSSSDDDDDDDDEVVVLNDYRVPLEADDELKVCDMNKINSSTSVQTSNFERELYSVPPKLNTHDNVADVIGVSPVISSHSCGKPSSLEVRTACNTWKGNESLTKDEIRSSVQTAELKPNIKSLNEIDIDILQPCKESGHSSTESEMQTQCDVGTELSEGYMRGIGNSDNLSGYDLEPLESVKVSEVWSFSDASSLPQGDMGVYKPGSDFNLETLDSLVSELEIKDSVVSKLLPGSIEVCNEVPDNNGNECELEKLKIRKDQGANSTHMNDSRRSPDIRSKLDNSSCDLETQEILKGEKDIADDYTSSFSEASSLHLSDNSVHKLDSDLNLETDDLLVSELSPGTSEVCKEMLDTNGNDCELENLKTRKDEGANSIEPIHASGSRRSSDIRSNLDNSRSCDFETQEILKDEKDIADGSTSPFSDTTFAPQSDMGVCKPDREINLELLVEEEKEAQNDTGITLMEGCNEVTSIYGSEFDLVAKEISQIEIKVKNCAPSSSSSFSSSFSDICGQITTLCRSVSNNEEVDIIKNELSSNNSNITCADNSYNEIAMLEYSENLQKSGVEESQRTINKCTDSKCPVPQLETVNLNSISRSFQSGSPVTPELGTPATSYLRKRKISAKDFQIIVNKSLARFYCRPWLRIGTLPHSPCTDSSTSCAAYHGAGKRKTSELSRQFSLMMLELMKEDFILEAFQYCLCHLSPTSYPSVKVMRYVVNIILNTDNSDVLISAQLILKTLLELHPPCADGMLAYYKAFLLDSWTENDKSKSPGIFSDILYKLDHALNDTDERRESYMDSEEEPKKHSFEDLPVIDRLQRIFIVFDFIVDVMVSDFLVWLVKHGCDLDMCFVTRPLIVSAIWGNSEIGTVCGTCKRLMDMYLKGFSSHQSEVHFKSFHRLFALVIEVMHAAELPSLDNILDYGQNCKNMAHKFFKLICGSDLNEDDLIYILKSLKPPWLPFYICDQLLFEDSATLATMKTYVENAFLQQKSSFQNVHQEELIPGPKIRHAHPKKPRTNLYGESMLHIACRKNNVDKLKEILTDDLEIDINEGDYFNWTPLHEAAHHGSVDCVKVLLSYCAPPGRRGIDLRACSDDGTTPLIDAIQQNQVEVCRLLLEFGGQELLKVKYKGRSPLDLTDNPEIKKILQSPPLQRNNISNLSRDKYEKLVLILPTMINCYLEFRQTKVIKLELANNLNPTPTFEWPELNVDLTKFKQDIRELENLKKTVKNLFQNHDHNPFLGNVVAVL